MLFTFTIFPIGSGSDLVPPVAAAVDRIASSGLPHQLTGSSTLVEGEWDEVMPVLEGCVKELAAQHPRVYALITIDHHAGSSHRISGAVRDVTEQVDTEVRTRP